MEWQKKLWIKVLVNSWSEVVLDEVNRPWCLKLIVKVISNDAGKHKLGGVIETMTMEELLNMMN